MVFELFAPRTDGVELLGSWADEAIPMERFDDGWWRAAVDLPDGEHRYRFRLPSRSSFLNGAVVDLTDPLARRIDTPRGESGVVIVTDGRDCTVDYAWEHDGVPLPDNRDLVVYELHVGEFSSRDGRVGTFLELVDRLDYLHELGVNAIELMPVAGFPGDRSWGYNPRHFFAPDDSYGTPQELQRLVDACHRRGMRVILDLVLNHAEMETPLTQIDFDQWFGAEQEGEPGFGPKFDYARFDEPLGIWPARAFGLRVARYWMDTYHLDGYRLDATRLIDDVHFLAELRDVVRHGAQKPLWLVAEHIPEDPAVALANGPMDGAWHQGFQHRVFEALTSGDPGPLGDGLQPRTQGYERPELVAIYLESHDEQPFLRRLLEAGFDEDAAVRKMVLATTLLFTAVGVPMIHMGQEFGGIRPMSTDIRPLEWEREETPVGRILQNHHRQLARIRHGWPALRTDRLELLRVVADAGLLMFRRGEGEGEVIVVLTVRDEAIALQIPFPNGRWRELVTDTEIEVTDSVLEAQLEPSGARVYGRI